MKIQFTLFNNGQEHYEFNTSTLNKGEKLEKFLISKDETGKIYVVPMICCNKNIHYALPVLERIK